MEIAVTELPDEDRYEVHVDNRPAGILTYRPEGDAIALLHTEVQPEYGGQGVGGRLVRGALDDLRGRGIRVIPLCPFVSSYIKRHQEYVDLVVDEYRAKVTQ